MIKKSHNLPTIEFLQKLLFFIDTKIIEAINSNSDSSTVLTSALLNIKDALLSEIVRDNQADQINNALTQEQKKKEEKDIIGQEKELEKDQ